MTLTLLVLETDFNGFENRRGALMDDGSNKHPSGAEHRIMSSARMFPGTRHITVTQQQRWARDSNGSWTNRLQVACVMDAQRFFNGYCNH